MATVMFLSARFMAHRNRLYQTTYFCLTLGCFDMYPPLVVCNSCIQIGICRGFESFESFERTTLLRGDRPPWCRLVAALETIPYWASKSLSASPYGYSTYLYIARSCLLLGARNIEIASRLHRDCDWRVPRVE